MTSASIPQAAGKRIDPLLVDVEGHVECIMGNEAIVRGALEAGVGFASGYPGTPSSEVTDSLARVAGERSIQFEYSVNEKIALEMAFAACLTGVRSICAMKHLGLMVAGDPLSTIPYVGVVGGLVIVSAGDPSCHTSPNEQDQRHLGRMLHLPVLDPSTPDEALQMTKMAFAMSEDSELPVLMRITARISHSRAPVRYGKLSEPRPGRFQRDPGRFVPIPVNARRLRGEIDGRMQRALVHTTSLYRQSGEGKLAIVSSGAPAATTEDLLAELGVEEHFVHARVGGVHPLPEEPLLALLGGVERVLVVEELSAYLEDALLGLCARRQVQVEVLGKHSGHLPEAFEYGPEIIERGLRRAFQDRVPDLALGEEVAELGGELAPVPPRPPVLCPGCPHRATYFAARAAFSDEQLYFNDIGCYTLGYGPPLNTADALLCMGAGITLADGVSRVTGERTVGFIGDSTFFHSGMPALLNAIKARSNIVVVVMDNEVTAMTGFQESPSAKLERSSPPRRVDIEGVVRALGADHVERFDPTNQPIAIAAFERARDAKGVSVLVSEHPCPVHVGTSTGLSEGATFVIDTLSCQSCGREAVGLRCDQCTSTGQERHMSRARALECQDSPAARASVAACTTACPLGLCVQGYAGHIASGQYQQALGLIMSRLPLPDSVCRVCHRPCEDVCVRTDLDGAVAINDLKRFVMDWAATEGARYEPEREADHGKSVAIVGAGPSGLGAAHELRLRGYQVTLLDAAPEPGGLLRYGIPRFRLPADALDRDIARILELGVAFEGGVRLGDTVQLSELLARGHDAVFLAVGAARSSDLRLEPPTDGPELVDALRYLESPDEVQAAGRVVVVGGGNAAMDAARTAARQGAQAVVVAYRRERDDMPALRDEVEEALAEGIDLRTQLQPLRLVGGAKKGLLCVRTEPGPPDESGRRRPQVVAGSEILIEADRVVAAIGQSPELGFAQNGEPLARTSDGHLKVDARTGQTSHPQIFAGGDVTQGERTVTDAIADGLRAAWGIDSVLRGQEAADRRKPPPRRGDWPTLGQGERAALLSRVDRGERARPEHLQADERRQSFREVAQVLGEAAAQAEARRCMVCGQCGNCRSCIDLFGCPAFHLEGGRVAIDPLVCTACGQCAGFCPNGAIKQVSGAELSELLEGLA